jgi:cytidylate kinase
MKLHILGASGSGVSTLGRELATRLNVPYFDADDFYWEKSYPLPGPRITMTILASQKELVLRMKPGWKKLEAR